MIKTVSIENFKCFENQTSFFFSKINLLTGINGRGKSSLLQSLLLLSQTFRKQKSPQKLIINGEWINLGTFEDIKNSDTDKKSVFLNIITDDIEQSDISFEYEESPSNERIANLVGLKVDQKDLFVEMTDNLSGSKKQSLSSKKVLTPIDSIKTFNQFYKFHYISADRLGPVEYVKKNNSPESLNVGIRGENLINVLAYNGNDIEIPENLCKNKSQGNKLTKQTIEWLSYILDGANLSIRKEKASSIIELLLNSRTNKKCYRPINVGFGYSYILPIIVSCLVSKPGDVMVIENPEAHLHPRAQSRISEFFSVIASFGVQIFIESHSEHILNGLRVNILKSKGLTSQDLSIYYWGEDSIPQRLEIGSNGKIQNWPLGFFDQQEADLAEIFNLGRLAK